MKLSAFSFFGAFVSIRTDLSSSYQFMKRMYYDLIKSFIIFQRCFSAVILKRTFLLEVWRYYDKWLHPYIIMEVFNIQHELSYEKSSLSAAEQWKTILTLFRESSQSKKSSKSLLLLLLMQSRLEGIRLSSFLKYFTFLIHLISITAWPSYLYDMHFFVPGSVFKTLPRHHCLRNYYIYYYLIFPLGKWFEAIESW